MQTKYIEGEIKDQAAGIGEKTLEGEALQQIRPELQWELEDTSMPSSPLASPA